MGQGVIIWYQNPTHCLYDGADRVISLFKRGGL
jgi:hypothetical protein